MRIVVTGAAGFIGSHLCERLADLGHDASGIDNFCPYYPRVLKDLNAQDVRGRGVPIHEMDLVDSDLKPVLDGAEVVYHVAAQPGISASVSLEEYVRNNLYATHRLVEALKGSRALRCLVYVSTSSVYGKYATDPEAAPPQPTSHYGVTKLAAEQLALACWRESKLPVCALRLFSVMGPRERPEKLYSKLIRCILEDREFPLCEGSREHSRSYTCVDDILDGFMSVLGRIEACLGEIFNIGSAIEMTTGEGMDIVQDLLGRKARIRLCPPRPGDQLRTRANIEKARRVLGYDPRRTLREGLEAQVRWYRDKVHGKVRF